MKADNIYINLVVLGNFNPSILTHKFLVKECNFDIGNEPKPKIPQLPTPVVASLEYDNISFFADLSRLQIMEKNCQDPKVSQLPVYLNTYLRKLPYTPVTKCGANFSYKLTIEKPKLDEIKQWLRSNRNKLCEVLQVKVLDVEVCFVPDGKKEDIKHWIVRAGLEAYNAITTMKVSNLSDVVQIDFNYEVGDIETNREFLNNITDEYPKVVDSFWHQVKKVFML